MNIAILDDYENLVKQLNAFSLLKGNSITILTKKHTNTELIKLLANIDVIIPIRERTKLNYELLKNLSNLKLISQTGKAPNYTIEACEKLDISLLESKGTSISTAELTWALILLANRRIIPYHNNLIKGSWQHSSFGIGKCLAGQTLGIWGYGKIGKIIAKYAKTFNANVLIWGSELSRRQAVKDGFSAAKSKSDFFKSVDTLTLHLRFNEKTNAFITENDLLKMKKDSILVNTSRAELIEDGALFRSLQQGRPGYAALDVFNKEPSHKNSELLLTLDNVFSTPHIGYVEESCYESYFSSAFENILNFNSKL